MISLEEYKKYLVNCYRYEIDNNSTSKNKRSIRLSYQYGDGILKRIILDTYSFIKDIFDSDTISMGYCEFELDEDTTSNIYLDICGGGYQDTVFIDLEERFISKYILKNTFGNSFTIYVEEDDEEFYDSEDGLDIVGIDCHYSLYLQVT